jgi:hypothetical protein
VSIRPQIDDPQGVQDPRAQSILRTVKQIVDRITGRGQGQAEIKTLGADATLSGVINKVNEIVNRLQQ